MEDKDMLKVILYQSIYNRFYITALFKYCLGNKAEAVMEEINKSIENTWNKIWEESESNEIQTNQSNE